MSRNFQRVESGGEQAFLGERGFTLVELMLVVAVIGILAAVAMPLYSDFTMRAKWSNNLTDVESLKTAIKGCLSDNNVDGTICDTVAELNTYGFAGTQLPTPRFSTGAATITGSAGKVNVHFTGSAEVGSKVYDADCASDTGGNISCVKTASDTVGTLIRGNGR